MTPLLAIRHGPTAWSAAGRLQGRSDPPLSAEGRAVVGRWRVPEEFRGFRWLTSPLRRATETAAVLGQPHAAVEPCLIEADLGRYEGRTLADLRASLGPAMAENEARGLDYRPEGGESPREVQLRLRPLLAALGAAGTPTAAVTHKGVVRALLSLATGWDMTCPPPVSLDWSSAHLFGVGPAAEVALERPNIALEP